ncbi:hypothetical protein FRC10_006220 [Ceratobasidium sp. 414]|nr:hypothetical protein FRC10_006220 [Ceratobasidium sp. 414]
MPDDPTSALATGMVPDLVLIVSDLMNSTVSSAEALATLISTIAEQNRLIKLLTERVGALESCSQSSRATAAGSPISPANDTQPTPGNDPVKDSNPPGQSRVLDAQTQPPSVEENSAEDSGDLPANSSSIEHPPAPPDTAPEADAEATSSAPSTPSPAVPLRHDAPAFSPTHPPSSFKYQYWPYPEYHPPMYPTDPPDWNTQPNHPSATGHAIASSRPDTATRSVGPVETSEGSSDAFADDPGATSLDQWGFEPVTGWGELEGDSVQKSPSKPEVRLDSNDSSGSAKKGKSKHNDNPNSTHVPDSETSYSEAGPSSDATTKQPKSSTKSMPECRYADKCTRMKCWFTHPPGWTPPSHMSEPTSDQCAPAPDSRSGDPGHAASSVSNEWPVEDDGWGTKRQESTAAEANADLGTWGTQSTNDWGTPTIDDWGPPASNDWGAPSNDGWASPAVKTAAAQAPNPASKPKEVPPKGPSSETRKGRKSRSARSRESTASSARSQSVLSTATTQLEVVDDVHDTVSEPSADASILDPVCEPDPDDIIVDSLGTPPLEPVTTPTRSSSLSEPESLSEPFSWGDEPLNDPSYIDSPTEDMTNLDTVAPSAMYTSWAPVEVSDWGPVAVDSAGDANGADETTHPVSQTDQEHVGGQPSAKAKGKRKETGQGKAAAASQAKEKRKPTNEAGPSTASENMAPQPPVEPAIPEPSLVPQGSPIAELRAHTLTVFQVAWAIPSRDSRARIYSQPAAAKAKAEPPPAQPGVWGEFSRAQTPTGLPTSGNERGLRARNSTRQTPGVEDYTDRSIDHFSASQRCWAVRQEEKKKLAGKSSK